MNSPVGRNPIAPNAGPDEITAVALRERDYYRALANSYHEKNIALVVPLSAILSLFDEDDPHMDPVFATALRLARAAINTTRQP